MIYYILLGIAIAGAAVYILADFGLRPLLYGKPVFMSSSLEAWNAACAKLEEAHIACMSDESENRHARAGGMHAEYSASPSITGEGASVHAYYIYVKRHDREAAKALLYGRE